MKFTSGFALAALAVGSAVADNAPLAERDLQTINSVLSNVDTAMRGLDQSVQAFNGDPAPLQRAAGQLIQTLQQGAQAVQATTPLTAEEAVTLQQSVGGLQTSGQSLVRNLETQRPRIQQANQCDTVRTSVTQISGGVNQLITSVVAKVPANLQPVAGQLTAPFTQIIAQTERNFGPGGCVNGQAGGGTVGGVPQNGTTLPGTQPGQVTQPGNNQRVNGAAGLTISVTGAVVAVFAASLML